MKNILCICLIACTAFTSTQAAATPQPFKGAPTCTSDLHKKITLFAGTPIWLETNEKVQFENVTVGKTIQFKVKHDVMAENEIALRTGAFALGRVKYVSAGTYNNPAEIRLELVHVQAVDGQLISLNGNEFSVYGEDTGRGTGGTVDFGSGITAQIMNNVDIKAQ